MRSKLAINGSSDISSNFGELLKISASDVERLADYLEDRILREGTKMDTILSIWNDESLEDIEVISHLLTLGAFFVGGRI